MTRLFGLIDLDLVEALFEGLQDAPFFVKDRDLRYVAANAAMAALCGARRPSDLYGRTAGDFFAPALARRYETMDRLVLDRGRPVANKLDLAKSRGAEPAWLLFSRRPVLDAENAVIGVAASSRRLKPTGPSNQTYERLSNVLARIEADFGQPLRLADLSALAGTSASQLEREFKTVFRMSIRDYWQKTRIEHALEALETQASVASVAYECGYTDQSAFARRFKSLIGVSPSDYRRRLGEKARQDKTGPRPVVSAP